MLRKFGRVAIGLICFLFLIKIFYWNVASQKKQVHGSFSKPIEFSELPLNSDLRYSLWEKIYSPKQAQYSANDVTLVTQCSANRLHFVAKILEQWRGPVSVAVFLPGNEIENFKFKLVSFISCNPVAQLWLTVHGVLPLSSPPFEKRMKIDKEFSDCKLQFEEDKLSRNYELAGNVAYPVNVLRNLAVKHVETSHIFVIDIDMLPSNSLRKYLTENQLLEKNKIALIVPAFEIEERQEFPNDKTDVLNYWERGIVRPFYEKACWLCQKQTNYDAWRSASIKGMFYEVEWKDYYEPFYVTRKEYVSYDERFERYGFNRISQLCSMYMQDINFFVLTNVFLMHSGFKRKDRFHTMKGEENIMNKLFYKKLKLELVKKYPFSKRRC